MLSKMFAKIKDELVEGDHHLRKDVNESVILLETTENKSHYLISLIDTTFNEVLQFTSE